MKSKSPLHAEPLLLDSVGAGQLLTRRALFDDMVRAGWIRPVVARHKCKLFCLDDLRRCVRRIKRGQYPGCKS
jgi:hypothetical protein